MKTLSAVLLSTIFLAPLPVDAYPMGKRSYETCEKYKFTEQYIPGYYNDNGHFVHGRVDTKKVKVSCYPSYNRPQQSYGQHYGTQQLPQGSQGGALTMLIPVLLNQIFN